MAEHNYILFVSSYADEGSAAEDFKAIKGMDDAAVAAAVVLSRDASGKTEVKEHGGGLVAGGTKAGAIGGLVVGLFAPPLLLSGVIGAGIGAGVGAIAKRHEEKSIGVDAESGCRRAPRRSLPSSTTSTSTASTRRSARPPRRSARLSTVVTTTPWSRP